MKLLKELLSLNEGADPSFSSDQERAIQNEISDKLGFDVEVTRIAEKDGILIAYYSYFDKNEKEVEGSMKFSASFAGDSLEHFAFINEAGRVFTVGTPQKRAFAYDGPRARAFDQVNRKTGERPDRSQMPVDTKYHAVESSNEGDYIQVLVMKSPGLPAGRVEYHGVNVMFMADGTVDAVTSDEISDEQWEEDRQDIIDIARKFVGRQVIAAFVERGGDPDLRGPDDFDNGHNGYSANPETHRMSDYHGYHDPKTNESRAHIVKR